MTRMEESDEDPITTTQTNHDSPTDVRDKLLDNDMRSFKNRGFHDGYDEGKKMVLQEAFDKGYKKAFEQNFILSTLKGVANALKSSYNLNQRQSIRPTSSPAVTSSSLSSSSSSSSSSASPSSSSSSSSTSSSSTSPPSSAASSTTLTTNHLNILEAMKFDGTRDIESIKNDLIKICRENKLEILAHYVSQIR